MITIEVESGSVFEVDTFMKDGKPVSWEDLTWHEREQLISSLKYQTTLLWTKHLTDKQKNKK